jgi:hypothetical protein
MKQNVFFSVALPVVSVMFLSVAGCNSNKNNEDMIVGEWKAYWETKADENFSELKAENLTMEGIMRFKADGIVEISAFGYEGCIFSDDTMKNVLNWKLDDSVIRFIDKSDDHGLPYTINKFTSNEMRLTLLEDINLTLRKN